MTGTEFLAAARRLEPTVAELRGRFDQDRHLPRRLVDELHAANLFRMWLPRAIGGAELAPLPFLEVIEELSRQDGSVGWCTVIPAGYARLSGALEEAVARKVFGTGMGVLVGTLNPTGKAVAAPGGYRVTGRWGYGSFIGYSDWVLGNCITEDGNFRLCLFPRTDVEVFDVWHVGGLRATGSNDYQVADLFVPEQHTIPLVDFQPPPRRPGPLYAVPMTSTFVSCVATVTLGIARAAIELAGGDRRGEEDRRPADGVARQAACAGRPRARRGAVGVWAGVSVRRVGEDVGRHRGGPTDHDTRAGGCEARGLSCGAMRDPGGGSGLSVGGWRVGISGQPAGAMLPRRARGRTARGAEHAGQPGAGGARAVRYAAGRRAVLSLRSLGHATVSSATICLPLVSGPHSRAAMKLTRPTKVPMSIGMAKPMCHVVAAYAMIGPISPPKMAPW